MRIEYHNIKKTLIRRLANTPAMISSIIIPMPPLSFPSICLMGGGFTISKKRNSIRARKRFIGSIGIKINAARYPVTSSITTKFGSLLPSFFSILSDEITPRMKVVKKRIMTDRLDGFRIQIITITHIEAPVPGAKGQYPI